MNSFIKVIISIETERLMVTDPKAFSLLVQIAVRGKIHNTKEVWIGDYSKMGLTRQTYRSALQRLVDNQHITIRSTSIGTVAKLLKSGVVEFSLKEDNHIANPKPTTILEDNIITNVINYLNIMSGSNFRAGSKVSQKHIRGRIAEGFTEVDMKKVVRVKCSQWKGTDMEQYLRPATLFAPEKFESYLNQKEEPPKSKGINAYSHVPLN